MSVPAASDQQQETEAEAQAGIGSKLLAFFPVLDRLGAPLRRKEIPFIQQTMATDCGAASLAMVLGYHGKHVELEDVRSVLQVTRDGVSARAIVEAADRFDLSARGVKVDIDDLIHLPQGSILHWCFSHFVVFDRLEGNILHIVDPALGPRKVMPEEVATSITGVAIILETRETFKKSKKLESVVFRYIRGAVAGSPDWGRIAAVSLMIEGLTVLLPLISGRLIDRVIPRHDLHLLYVLVAAFAFSAVFYMVSSLVRGHLLLHLKTRFDARMTMSFVQHILKLPYDFFELRQPADLQMRVNSIQSIRDILTGAVLSGALDGTMVIAHLVFLAAMSWRMLGIALIIVAVQGGLYLATRRRLRDLSADVIVRQTEASNSLNELLSGIESLKACGVEQRAAQTWAGQYVDVMNITLRRGATQATSEAVLNTLKIGGPVLLMIMGIVDVMQGNMSLGTMMSANAMAVGFIVPTMQLLSTLQQLQAAKAQIMRVEDVVNTPGEQAEGGRRIMAPKLKGQISMDRVSFRYGPKLPPAVREVSVDIRPGELVAIVGRSGSGKSTLGRLLVGLYQPGEGGIRIDGMPLQQLDLQSLRQQLGVVVQRAHVFGTTVRANIALGEPSTPLAEVMNAAKLARIHEDIAKLPLGYDTPLIAGGASLSGGQRQRIALARALLHRPAVLLLDEATSALDAVTESEVTKQLDALPCTRIVIAHRLSTVVNAHRILVMDQGRLVEQGTHAELMARGGIYSQLAKSQLAGDVKPQEGQQQNDRTQGTQRPATGAQPAGPMNALAAQMLQAQLAQQQHHMMQAQLMQQQLMQQQAMQQQAIQQQMMAQAAQMRSRSSAPPPVPQQAAGRSSPPPVPQQSAGRSAPPPAPTQGRSAPPPAPQGRMKAPTGPLPPAMPQAPNHASSRPENVLKFDELRAIREKRNEARRRPVENGELARAVGAGADYNEYVEAELGETDAETRLNDPRYAPPEPKSPPGYYPPGRSPQDPRKR